MERKLKKRRQLILVIVALIAILVATGYSCPPFPPKQMTTVLLVCHAEKEYPPHSDDRKDALLQCLSLSMNSAGNLLLAPSNMNSTISAL